jgi:hypothetical protein
MTKLNLNLDKIRDATNDIPPGLYLAELTRVMEDTSNSGGNMLDWTWRIEQGPHEGKQIVSFTSLQEHALHETVRTLKALGLKGQVDVDTDTLIGKPACLVVGQRTIISEATGKPREVPTVLTVMPAAKFKELKHDPTIPLNWQNKSQKAK